MTKYILLCFSLLALLTLGADALRGAERPNVVILFADDMGYGDLGCYGHPQLKTPNIDRLAAEGMRLTSFVTGSWCVPSRAQLITGRYMPRIQFKGGTGAGGRGGLPASEWTLAEALRDAGYRTHMLGKWHLGYKDKQFLPVHQGFETWFGLPYSNDYIKPWVQTDEPLGLYRGDEMVEHPFDQDPLTQRYTAEAVKLIEQHSGEQPMLLYMAYAMPHLPLHASDDFRGSSQFGLYGDVIEELDWSVGEILAALARQGMAENTLVFFASDNGPWVEMPPRMLQAGNERWHAGSAGPLRGSKGMTYEGGPRVPAILRWPTTIEPGQVTPELVGMPDIYRTLLAVAEAKLPEHELDGHDLTAFLSGAEKRSPRDDYFYFRGQLEAVRVGDWKLRTASGEPELFHMASDPFERINRAESEPDKVAELTARMQAMADEVGTQVRGL
ncbi:sulfatase family protein [Candidatus Laterigemmans baculatus]|uniref:sulfatase family protein n=1 Tax=Candidatus Laterigemmans baculatus TaxID=2770505 RepID=UPI00193C5856|nr:sulfatase [Candidatus Laterigemmans baculatus]